jgi:hypothetical protein
MGVNNRRYDWLVDNELLKLIIGAFLGSMLAFGLYLILCCIKW